MVEPDDIIAPYDTTLAERRPFGGPRLPPNEFDAWLYAHVQAWRSRYATPSSSPRLIVLAGRGYWRCLVDRGLEVCAPLDGLGIGQRLRWLKQQVALSQAQETRRPGQRSLFPGDDAPSTPLV